MTRKISQVFYISLGSLFLLIGIIGIFLPLLPTTPFLLLTAFFYNRGSDKFHGWLINHKILGPPILDWQQNQVIRLKFKILASVMMLGSSGFVFPKPSIPLAGKVAYSLVLLLVMTFIWTRKHR